MFPYYVHCKQYNAKCPSLSNTLPCSQLHTLSIDDFLKLSNLFIRDLFIFSLFDVSHIFFPPFENFTKYFYLFLLYCSFNSIVYLHTSITFVPSTYTRRFKLQNVTHCGCDDVYIVLDSTSCQ